MSIKTSIVALIGTPTSSDTDITRYIQEGIRDVVQKTITKTPNRIGDFVLTVDDIDDNEGISLDAPITIISVIRNEVIASEIPISMKKIITSSNSLHERDSSDPVYWIEDQKVYFYPEPSGSDKAEVTSVSYDSTANYSSSSIDKMPNDREDLVILYSAIKCIMHSMNTIFVSLGTPPTYSGPVVFPDYTAAEAFLTDEDIELVQTKLGIIQSQIGEYGTSIQDSLNRFNKENSVYMASLQESQGIFQQKQTLYTQLKQQYLESI